MADPQTASHSHPLPSVPDRPDDAHKGTFGMVIVLGGSPTMIGAPAMCAAAALRGGAGLVKVACGSQILGHVLTIEPGATGIALDGPIDHTLGTLDSADPDHRAVLAVGPGLGEGRGIERLVSSILLGRRTVVLDADGLNALAHTGHCRRGRDAALVLTPHPGEFRRLAQPLGIDQDPTAPNQRPDAAAALAKAHRAVVVLKGRRTVVADGERVYLNDTGNPALATAGTGDVLTGLLAALIAQGMAPFDAAALACHLHGKAADQWAQAHGRSGMLARNLADQLPDTFEAARQK